MLHFLIYLLLAVCIIGGGIAAIKKWAPSPGEPFAWIRNVVILIAILVALGFLWSLVFLGGAPSGMDPHGHLRVPR